MVCDIPNETWKMNQLTIAVSHNTFFTFMAELKNPRDFPKALALLQTIDMTLYIIAAVVIYRYAGPDVSSPALGSASPLVSRIAYGIALPTVWMFPDLCWMLCSAQTDS